MCGFPVCPLIRSFKNNFFKVVLPFGLSEFNELCKFLREGEVCYDFFPMDC